MSSLIIRGEEKHGMATWSHSDQSTPKPQVICLNWSQTTFVTRSKDHKRSHSNHWRYLVIFLYLSASLPYVRRNASQLQRLRESGGLPTRHPCTVVGLSDCPELWPRPWPRPAILGIPWQLCMYIYIFYFIHDIYMTIRSNQYKYN